MNITFKILASSVVLIAALAASCKKQDLSVSPQTNQGAVISGRSTSPKPNSRKNFSESNKVKNQKPDKENKFTISPEKRAEYRQDIPKLKTEASLSALRQVKLLTTLALTKGIISDRIKTILRLQASLEEYKLVITERNKAIANSEPQEQIDKKFPSNKILEDNVTEIKERIKIESDLLHKSTVLEKITRLEIENEKAKHDAYVELLIELEQEDTQKHI